MALRIALLLLMCSGLAGLGLAGDDVPARAELQGTVQDADGKPIAGAIVSINGAVGGPKKQPVETDADGTVAGSAPVVAVRHAQA